MRHQVERLGGVAREHDLRRRRADERRHRVARALVGRGRRLAERVHAAMHVGAHLGVVARDRVDDRARLGRGRRAVEVGDAACRRARATSSGKSSLRCSCRLHQSILAASPRGGSPTSRRALDARAEQLRAAAAAARCPSLPTTRSVQPVALARELPRRDRSDRRRRRRRRASAGVTSRRGVRRSRRRALRRARAGSRSSSQPAARTAPSRAAAPRRRGRSAGAASRCARASSPPRARAAAQRRRARCASGARCGAAARRRTP